MTQIISIITNKIFVNGAGNCKNLSTSKSIHILRLFAFFAIMALCTSTSIAQPSFSQEEITKLDSYAQILGQAWACNIDCKDEADKIYDWLKKRMDAGYPDRLFKFIDDKATHNFIQQDFARYPAMTCDRVRNIFNLNCQKRTCAEVRKIFEATVFDLP